VSHDRPNPWCLQCGRPVDEVRVAWDGQHAHIQTECHGQVAEAIVAEGELGGEGEWAWWLARQDRRQWTGLSSRCPHGHVWIARRRRTDDAP
jgi:hypothetical protein